MIIMSESNVNMSVTETNNESNCDKTKCDNMVDGNCSKEGCDPSQCETNVCEDTTENAARNSSELPPGMKMQMNLVEIDIVDTNTALNVLVGFLGVAQKRGAFAINESAKIFECINQFTEQ